MLKMIQYVKRNDLNVAKYDACIENSLQGKLFAFSWYLDIVADNWDVLVFGNYRAVMPIPWRRKYGIKYVYPPFWVLELGVFSLNDEIKIDDFFSVLQNHFRFVKINLNAGNFGRSDFLKQYNREFQFLNLNKPYQKLFDNYRKDRKKDINKAKNSNFVIKWNDNPEKLIQLFKDNVGQRTPNILAKDYSNLKKVIEKCIEKNAGEVLSIYNDKNKLVASGFFLNHKHTVTILCSSTDFKNRKNGENTFLIDSAIQKYTSGYEFFNFGGSSIQSVAKYFLSFGAKTLKYPELKINKLPWYIRIFKS